MMNLGAILTRHARYRPDHLAVVFRDQRLTYREFNRRVNYIANALLEAGMRKGEKVATILPNCLELLEVYWAVAKTGAVVVPLSPLLRGRGLTSELNDSDSAMVITHRDLVEHLEPLKPDLPNIPPGNYVLTDSADTPGYRFYHHLTAQASDGEPVDEDGKPIINVDTDPYNIIYSSGTVGLPKGIVHTHYIRAMYSTLFAASYRITPESIVLHAGSLVFNGAFLTLMPAFFAGATYILQPHFDAEQVIDAIQRERVTHIKLVPSQIIALLHSPRFNAETCGSLEMLGSVGAPLHHEHKERLNHLLPRRFYELYGLTEGFVTILDRYDVERKMDSVGVPPPLMELRIVDDDGNDLPPGRVGEIVGRGPILMPGYYKRDDLTAQAIRGGWLFTGDLGSVDEDGFLYLVDRKKDLIISGGVNVYPRDIEEVAVQHPAVKDAAVFGVPSERWGETPIAAIILKTPGGIGTVELRDWINERIVARYQHVYEVIVLNDFPRGIAGKTLKRVMRDEYCKNLSGPIP